MHFGWRSARRGVDRRDGQGATALYRAASSDDGDTVRRLLEAGADPNALGPLGHSPYYVALTSPWSTPEVIAMMRRAGADPVAMTDVFAVDRYRRTPLHYAASGRTAGGVELVEGLLAGGADVHARDAGGWTPLHFAAGGDDPDIARVLLVAGAEVDAVDAEGNTPLIAAVRRSQAVEDMADLLRERGADPHRMNDKGWSAVRIARRDVIGGNSEQCRRAFDDLPELSPQQPPPEAPTPSVSSVRDALVRLRDEGLRNGNLNWATGRYPELAEHVRASLDDATLFSAVELAELREDLARLADPSWLGSPVLAEYGDAEFERLFAATERWESARPG